MEWLSSRFQGERKLAAFLTAAAALMLLLDSSVKPAEAQTRTDCLIQLYLANHACSRIPVKRHHHDNNRDHANEGLPWPPPRQPHMNQGLTKPNPRQNHVNQGLPRQTPSIRSTPMARPRPMLRPEPRPRQGLLVGRAFPQGGGGSSNYLGGPRHHEHEAAGDGAESGRNETHLPQQPRDDHQPGEGGRGRDNNDHDDAYPHAHRRQRHNQEDGHHDEHGHRHTRRRRRGRRDTGPGDYAGGGDDDDPGDGGDGEGRHRGGGVPGDDMGWQVWHDSMQCCRWLRSVEDACVCDVLVHLPKFLTKPVHRYTATVGNTCRVNFDCGGM